MTVNITYSDTSSVCINKVRLNGLDYFARTTLTKCILQSFQTAQTKILVVTYTTFFPVQFTADLKFLRLKAPTPSTTALPPTLPPTTTTTNSTTTTTSTTTSTTTLKTITVQPTLPKTLTPDTKGRLLLSA